MSSFLSKLFIDGEEHNILEFDMELSQSRDQNGKPNTVARGGEFYLVIESTRATDFLDWMLSSTQTKSGSIVFYRRDAMSKLRELKFQKAFCVNYRENFKANDETPMKIEMTISAKEITFGSSKLKKSWPITL